ncbi:MAG: ShlB/FhaC/HecB family hemolysin secretion/activation protein [Gammaproteobacteria bacterium]|nr:ShlB/FhaC/HecB family hemolysin secretion/activation protein [Gammaproteobacteria bacterium]
MVLEARLGRVTASDNRWFQDASILGAARLSPGDKVSASTLEEDLAWLNRNPFRQVDAVFVQGAEPGTTDVQLEVKERYPLRPYVSYNNSGNPAIGEHMVSAGLNWGNVFDTDHHRGWPVYERTCNIDGLAAHRLSYTAPLPWRHELSISASHIETDSELFDVFGLSGRSSSVAARYSMPVPGPAIAGFSHQVQAGVDFRRTNNNLEFFGNEVFDDSSDIIQLAAEYSGRLPDQFGVNRWYANLVVSPGGLAGRG